ncbi:hypothetical protein [Streptomyces sp. NPDC095613]|uniref:hypothetical protein n=1 Tax=Streptomyces sp. NPDC095613 TaxID=3155540 RepID=UPI00332EAA3D
MRVPQHHQVRARHLRMIRHRGVELPLEVRDFLVAPGGGRPPASLRPLATSSSDSEMPYDR